VLILYIIAYLRIPAYMKRRSIFLAFGIILAMPFANGQDVAIGQWKDYLSYYQGIRVAQGGTKFYCTSPSGIFSYNTADNSIEKYNKVTGLSDVVTSVAKYTGYNNSLFIGYTNGNMDILQNNQVVNIADLKNKILQGSKAINDVYFYQNYAYVSCGQGIMQVDINLDVIQNTYYIGANSSVVNVHQVTIFNDTMYAASDNGIFRISMNDANPDYYADWQHLTKWMPGNGKYNSIVSVGNSIYASKVYNSGKDTIFQYTNGKWSVPTFGTGNIIINLQSSNGNLVVTDLYDVRLFNSLGQLVTFVSTYSAGNLSPNDAIADANQNLWIADNAAGMIETAGSGSGVSYSPPGPYSNNVFSVTVNNNNVWITQGGYSNTSYGPYFLNGTVSVEYNNTWFGLTDNTKPLSAMNCLAVDPHNPAHAFAGSFVYGLVEYNVPNVVKVYDTTNSQLQAFSGAGWDLNAGVAYDSVGNLWVTNCFPYSGKFLSVKKPDNSWYAFNFTAFLPPNLSASNVAATKLLITQSQAKWVILPGQGILVYQDNGTLAAPSATNSIIINTTKGHGGLPSLNVYAMAQDQDGSIWVGTNLQVVVFYNPDNVLDGLGDWDAQNVYVIQNTYTQYLMQNQTTTAIAVDGANRKWIGTQSGGVFLMSPDGTQQVSNFTAENSPLFSDNISCITINSQNGEVFFGTDVGLVSYRGTATEGLANFGNVFAFPNPVTHDYTGNVGINGLVTNADVKITDINGELVYHTIALGGQAIWNCNNFNGQRVKTGVYLIFCSSPDGSQSRVAKLLMIN
jgi:hypothetical protein